MKAEFPELAPIGACARASGSVITHMMAAQLARPEMLSLAAGFTDNRVLPVDLIRTISERLLAAADAPLLLQYGPNRGRPELRSLIAGFLRSYPGEADMPLAAEDVLVCNGSQQGLYLLTQMLGSPGDIVLVEEPSYFVYLELLRGLGLQAVALPCDEQGQFETESLNAFFEQLATDGRLQRLKLVYLMGTFANPSTRSHSEASLNALAVALRALPLRLPVIEDMAYRELYFDQPYPARSLLALPAWQDWPVVLAGTFTKPFATGLKVGFLVSRQHEILDTLAAIKGHHDFGTAHFNQAIIEVVLGDGLYDAHLRAIRSHYARKCRVLEAALRAGGLEAAGWHWEAPQGGLLLWASGPQQLDTSIDSAFYTACLEADVLYVPGNLSSSNGRLRNCARLSFGALEEERIPEAAGRFCAAASAFA